jgi:hypothetical protein
MPKDMIAYSSKALGKQGLGKGKQDADGDSGAAGDDGLGRDGR